MTAQHRKKSKWIVEKERQAKNTSGQTIWLFGLHAVGDALLNPQRVKHRLVVTKNAGDRLAQAISTSGMVPDIVEPRKFNAPIDAQSVHQGAALEVSGLDWGDLSSLCYPGDQAPRLLLLDRVTDPHNVGAILRSAEVFGARAVIAPLRHSAPETGALAKTASGALERQPYLRVRNLSTAMKALKEMGYHIIGLDGTADVNLGQSLKGLENTPVALALGAEGPGLRDLTRKTCHQMARIDPANEFASLNVSNAAAVALFAATNAAG